MAKLVHLKKQDGKSFFVTPHAFETSIKTEKNWRKKYDYVGEVDEDEVGHKSESAQGQKNETKTTDGKAKVSHTDVEEKNEDIFKTKNGGVSEVEQFEAHMEKAHEFMQEEKLDEARAEVKKALLISPTSKAAGRALEAINAEIEAKEKNAEAEIEEKVQDLLGKAREFVSKKKYPKAKAEVEAALLISPEHGEATSLLSEISELSK